jgi:hypothetical protein
MANDDSANELRRLTERFKVCWDVFPEFSGTNHQRVQTGFTVELYGTHERDDVSPTAGCRHCIPVLQALLTLADYVVPPAWRAALESIRAHSGLEYAVERDGRPDVVVAVTLLPAAAPAASTAISQCLADIRGRLLEIGAAERSWRVPPAALRTAPGRTPTPQG